MSADLLGITSIISNTGKALDELFTSDEERIKGKIVLLQLQTELSQAILTQQTVPWVDALVKLVLALYRPTMTAFIAYYGVTHPELFKELMGEYTPGGQTAMAVPFFWWMNERRKEKNKDREERRINNNQTHPYHSVLDDYEG